MATSGVATSRSEHCPSLGPGSCRPDLAWGQEWGGFTGGEEWRGCGGGKTHSPREPGTYGAQYTGSPAQVSLKWMGLCAVPIHFNDICTRLVNSALITSVSLPFCHCKEHPKFATWAVCFVSPHGRAAYVNTINLRLQYKAAVPKVVSCDPLLGTLTGPFLLKGSDPVLPTPMVL